MKHDIDGSTQPFLYCAASFFHIIFLSMDLIPRIDVMFEIIWIGPVELQGTRNKWKNTKWKNLAHSGIHIVNLEMHLQAAFRMSEPGIDEKSRLKIILMPKSYK